MADPNFMIIGAQKSGTSWLTKMLCQHPDIYVPERKELHFFNLKENYERGMDWYRAQFDGWSGEQRIGDCTPTYLWVNNAPESGQRTLRARSKLVVQFEENNHLNRNMAELIWNQYPDLKLIVILRNPVERAISGYIHSMRFRYVSPRSNIVDMGGRRGIISIGFYCEQLLKWMEYFHRDQFLILVYEEDIVQNSSETLRKVFQHLQVDPEFQVSEQSAVVNRRACNLYLYLNYYAPWLPAGPINRISFLQRHKVPPIRITASDRARLFELYEPEFPELEALIGRSLNAWNSDHRTQALRQ